MHPTFCTAWKYNLSSLVNMCQYVNRSSHRLEKGMRACMCVKRQATSSNLRCHDILTDPDGSYEGLTYLADWSVLYLSQTYYWPSSKPTMCTLLSPVGLSDPVLTSDMPSYPWLRTDSWTNSWRMKQCNLIEDMASSEIYHKANANREDCSRAVWSELHIRALQSTLYYSINNPWN